MALTGTDKAYLYARSNIARSGATRSNYVAPFTTVEWIQRDSSGNIIATTNITDNILVGSLHITQAINDEPDTASFEMRPQASVARLASTPAVGDEIRIGWTTGPGATLFHGYAVVVQHDWRLGNLQPPWVAVQCQDAMWRFDARLVTYKFPAQSVTASIEFLVEHFCNLDTFPPGTPHPLDFVTTAVVPGMPSIAAFEVVNQRPSTVMRTLTAAVGGGFYIDGLTVHAWANALSEPNQNNPTPLTVGLATLKAFRMTTDATQLRRTVLVEGQRTSTLISWPTCTPSSATGLPLDDASMLPTVPEGAYHLARLGTQWVACRYPQNPTGAGTNPPQGKVTQAFTPDQSRLWLTVNVPPPSQGWIRVGNQYASYHNATDGPAPAAPVQLYLDKSYNPPYGVFTAPIAIGETVEWVDAARVVQGKTGYSWTDFSADQVDNHLVGHPASTPVVTLAVATLESFATPSTWPPLESLVQDGRYSYEGAQARADADLDAFKDPLVSAEWVTEDYSALPGREQVIALSSETVTPPVNLTVTIISVEITFPLRTLAPRRACVGGVVKPSSFLDLVVTTSD